MNVLVACEESQEVCKAFRKKGHNAFSCDIIECSGGFPEWHILSDCKKVMYGRCNFKTQDGKEHFIKKWNMIIAFPPCTDLAVSGARWFKEKQEDGRQQKSIEFFLLFTKVHCNKVVIENPIGIMSNIYQKPTQIIQPWMFGDNFAKSTCLWIKGLKPLIPKVTVKPELEYFEWVDKKTGKKKRQNTCYKDAWSLPKSERAKIRSKTFPGIARAMAEQWG